MKKSIFIIILSISTLFAQGITNTLGGATGLEKFIVENSNAESGLVVTSRGWVGIGTAYPTSRLTVYDNSSSYALFQNAITEPGYWKGFYIGLGEDISDAYIWNFEESSLEFGTSNRYRMSITATGNVGVGTETPNELLEIAGNGRAFFGDGGGDSRKGLLIDGVNPIRLEAYDYGTSVGLPLVINTVGQGNVGVGTTNPQGKLDVNGSIYQRGGQLHADYVFEDDYYLESIEDHSNYMWAHKHLPAIPKAQKDENGSEIVEVGSHRKGIVEELEKAHIYIEQLNQQNTVLEKRLTKLEQLLSDGD